MDQQAVTAMPHDAAKVVQEKQLLLTRLLGRLAHEIRNPLSSLDIHVQLLEEDMANIPADVRGRSVGRFQIIRTELERLDNLVKQFLTLAGRTAPCLQRVDVAEVATHVCELLRPQAAAHGIHLGLNLPRSMSAVVADPDQLTQVLVNLVLNAIQAVDRDGHVTIAAEVLEATREAVIAVEDTGPGVDEANAAMLFEPFYTTREEGSGLGLWIVRQIAVAHNGSITAANRHGGGAIFRLTLPLHFMEGSHG